MRVSLDSLSEEGLAGNWTQLKKTSGNKRPARGRVTLSLRDDLNARTAFFARGTQPVPTGVR
jgi:hypothetical protein